MMYRTILAAGALALMISAGVVHGVWTDRWSDPVDLGAAAQALERVPHDLGSWHGEDLEMEKDARLGLAGTLCRRYTHGTTGRSVTVFLACGRPGPVSTHTPDVCYVCQGYTEAESPRRYQLGSATAQVPPEFWTARYVKQRNDGVLQLRIYWGWLAGGHWQAAENPRLAFAGERVLHKLYVLREQPAGEVAPEREPCAELIQELLPELGRALAADRS